VILRYLTHRLGGFSRITSFALSTSAGQSAVTRGVNVMTHSQVENDEKERLSVELKAEINDFDNTSFDN
jgi:hypothetical protein